MSETRNDEIARRARAAAEERRFNEPLAKYARVSSDAVIVIDGVFFQHNRWSGIARVWRTLLQTWLESGFAKSVVVLDRAGTAPRLPGIRYRSIPAWDERMSGSDSLRLQKICEQEGAGIFVSSYYTAPTRTPAVFLAHDCIPELLGVIGKEQIWQEKRLAIAHASAFICVSSATKRELARFYPEADVTDAVVIPNAADEIFEPASDDEVAAFRRDHKLDKPYFLLVGERIGLKGYKNTKAFLGTFQTWHERDGHTVLCAGGLDRIEAELRAAAPDADIRRFNFDDARLRLAYCAAAALIYLPQAEGFGLPIVEAMACGCPVVTTRALSIPEVAGEAALYVDPSDGDELIAALERVSDPTERPRLRQAGLAQATNFSWTRTAARYAEVLSEALDAAATGEIAPPSHVWDLLREEQQAWQSAAIGGRSTKLGLATWRISAQKQWRQTLFRVRSMLLDTTPRWAMPVARRSWRLLMGIKV